MSLYVLASGMLVADPVRRDGAKGVYATALLRVEADKGEQVMVSVLGFDEIADRLLEMKKGAALAVSGRARLDTWQTKNGSEKHGLGLVAAEIAALKPRRKAQDAQERRAAPAARQEARKRGPGAPYSRPFDDRIPW